MTNPNHLHNVAATVNKLKTMYPEARITTDEHHHGTRIRAWQEPIGCIDARFIPYTKDDE